MTDRRKRVRVRVQCPVSLYRAGSSCPIRTRTEDLSSEGFYCIADERLAPDEKLIGVIEIGLDSWNRPEQVLRLQCRVWIARVDPLEGARFGLDCLIHDYSVLAPCTGESEAFFPESMSAL